MAHANTGDTVQVHYTGKLKDGQVFDSSRERDPMQITLGKGQVIPGFEQAIVGMEPGEQKSTTIPAEEAFGERRPELIAVVKRDDFKTDHDLEVGQRFSVKSENGQQTFRIVELDEATAKIDGNHELAGKDLVFDIELVAIV